MGEYRIPIIARGEVIEDYQLAHKGRFGSEFHTPDPHKYLPKLLLKTRSEMGELYTLSLDEIVDFLVELGKRMDLRTNPHVQWALELNDVFSDNPKNIVRTMYEGFGPDDPESLFAPQRLEAAIATVGREHLDGWATQEQYNGRSIAVRAVGVPTVHVVAGNAPGISFLTLIRNALVRGYAIVKIPSNELGAAVAIARTMIDMAPDHPLTRAFSCAYWKGGDEAFEEKIYHPRHIDRIVAWGGSNAIKHIAGYLRPGLDLVTFDPKLSRVLLGPEAFDSEAAMRDVARRLAADAGYLNQIGCASCRLIFARCDTDDEGIERLKRLSQLIYEEIQNLPREWSGVAQHMDPELESMVDSLCILDDEYYVVGGDRTGGVILSLNGEQVDFAAELAHRIVNLIPIPDYEVAMRHITRDVQTVAVYPEGLRDELRMPLALNGVQRITSLGYMLSYDVLTTTHDGTEGLRRMATWVVSEDCMTNVVPVPWRRESDRS